MLWREHQNDISVSFSSNNVSRKRKAEPFSHCSYFRGHSRNQPKGMGRRNSLNVTPWQVSQTYMYFTELTHTKSPEASSNYLTLPSVRSNTSTITGTNGYVCLQCFVLDAALCWPCLFTGSRCGEGCYKKYASGKNFPYGVQVRLKKQNKRLQWKSTEIIGMSWQNLFPMKLTHMF